MLNIFFVGEWVFPNLPWKGVRDVFIIDESTSFFGDKTLLFLFHFIYIIIDYCISSKRLALIITCK
jgi:hypothetical protein